MTTIVYYYDFKRERILVYDGVLCYQIAGIQFDFLTKMFWETEPIWVNSFGKVPRNICFEYAFFGVEPYPQAHCEAVEKWILDNRSSWEMDLKTSLFYSIDSIRRYVDVAKKKLNIKSNQPK